MNIEITIKDIKGIRPLNIKEPYTFTCNNGMYIGQHSDCETLKLNLNVTDPNKIMLDNSTVSSIIVDGKPRQIIKYWDKGTMFDLIKL